jgi:1,2-diacylglycerol 3-alpha-glucosyltransferase
MLVCSGLEHARRGFESFARECFDTLRPDPGIRLELVKGTGPRSGGEATVPLFRRDRRFARTVGRMLSVEPFRVESSSFTLALGPLLRIRQPTVVYTSGWDIARLLRVLRRVLRLDYKILFCNGAMAVRGFHRFDRVQQLTPAAVDQAREYGEATDNQVLLPLGFHVDPVLDVPNQTERGGLRRNLGLPADRQVLLSVAALNQHHKRLGYVIDELAASPEPRPYLLLAGEPDHQTAGLEMQARRLLGPAGYSMRTVPREQVPDLYRASDLFVLASLYEGLPRALIEAASYGLPCLVHDYPVTEFALGPHRVSADLRRPGALATILAQLRERPTDPARATEQHSYVYEHFSWDRLRGRYVALLRDVAGCRGALAP